MTHSVRLSVRPSVRPSVCRSVPLSFFSFFAAPAHPHATSACVYGLVSLLVDVQILHSLAHYYSIKISSSFWVVWTMLWAHKWKGHKTNKQTMGMFLVIDFRIFKGPLSCSLLSFAWTAHSAHLHGSALLHLAVFTWATSCSLYPLTSMWVGWKLLVCFRWQKQTG